MSNTIAHRVRVIALAALILGGAGASAHAQQSRIIVALGDDARGAIAATLLQSVLVKAGFKAELSPVAHAQLPSALGAGEVHVAAEVSVPALAQFSAEIDQGRVLDQGYRQAGASDPKYKKLVWSGMRRRWSGAVKLIKNMTLPESDTQAMLAAVADGQSVDAVVADWLANNRARTSKWKSASVNWMKP